MRRIIIIIIIIIIILIIIVIIIMIIVSPSGHPPTLSDRRSSDFYLNVALLPPCEALVVGLEIKSTRWVEGKRAVCGETIGEDVRLAEGGKRTELEHTTKQTCDQ